VDGVIFAGVWEWLAGFVEWKRARSGRGSRKGAEWEEEGELKAKVRRTATSSRVAREIRVICSEGVGCARSGYERGARLDRVITRDGV
jgi:hypothetical protein